MKLRLFIAVAALVGAARAVVACVGSDPNPESTSPDDGGGGQDATQDTGGGTTDSGGTQDTGSNVDAGNDGSDGATCPMYAPNALPGVHCPDTIDDVCDSGAYCCDQELDGGGAYRQCLGSGSSCGSTVPMGPHWACESQTTCGSGKVCAVAGILPRDGGCAHEYDIPFGAGGNAVCSISGSQPDGSTVLCANNDTVQCGVGVCRPAVMHFPDSGKTFVIGVCAP